MSRLVLPQPEQFYPDVLSVFVGLDKVSTEIQGLSSTYCNFQGLSRCVRTLGKSSPSLLPLSRSLSHTENKTFYLPLLSEAEHHLPQNFSVKVMLHGTIRNDDFLCNTALQCWNIIAKA